MEIKKVHDRGDGVLKVTIPSDSNISEGDYVRITKVEEKEDAELSDEQLLKRIKEVQNGDSEMISLEEAREMIESKGE